MQYHSTPFPCGRRLLCIFNTLWRVSSMQRLWVNWVSAAIHYYMPLLSGYDHASSLRMSANADLSTTLKCSASGKKSTEQSIPIDPRQPSVLEPLIVCYFHILLAYHCIVYYGMLNYTACAWSPPWLNHAPCILIKTWPLPILDLLLPIWAAKIWATSS